MRSSDCVCGSRLVAAHRCGLHEMRGPRGPRGFEPRHVCRRAAVRKGATMDSLGDGLKDRGEESQLAVPDAAVSHQTTYGTGASPSLTLLLRVPCRAQHYRHSMRCDSGLRASSHNTHSANRSNDESGTCSTRHYSLTTDTALTASPDRPSLGQIAARI